MIATLLVLAVVFTVLGAYSVLLLAVFCPSAYSTGYADAQADARRTAASGNVTLRRVR